MRGETPCYQKRNGVNGSDISMDNLRLELDSNSFYLLSYHHVELVKFESTPDVDIIAISFLNRTVRIKGKNLRNLGVALQTRCVEFIKPMAERYSSLAAGEDGWVKSIEILEQKEEAHA